MRKRTVLLLLAVQVATQLFGGAKITTLRHQRQTFGQSGEIVAGVVIVKFKRGATIPGGSLAKSQSTTDQLMANVGVTSSERMFSTTRSLTDAEIGRGLVDLSQIYYAYLRPHLDPREVAAALSGLQDVEYAEPKHLQYLNDIPNDPSFLPFQSGYFGRMNAPDGWTLGKGDTNVVIADVDGGTLWQHADIGPNLWINKAEDLNHNGRFDPGPPPSGDEDGIDADGNGFTDDVIGWNFANNSNDPRGLATAPESFDHGTATASTFSAATNNGAGMAGSSWNCRLMPICSASPTIDNGIAFGYEGIQYAFSNGAKVINCSWGARGGSSRFEQDVINAATQAGAFVVASAGNDNNNSDFFPSFPANYRNVLAVGATNSSNDVRAGFSNYGVTVPVYAPGVSIVGALSDGSYGIWGGTSFSSPLVAGLAGILKSVHPTWTPRQIATQIRVTADSIDNVNPSDAGKLGRGRVNFARALTEAHPGIEILSSTILTPSGKTLFLTGDTVSVRVTVKNILFSPAANLSFTVSSSDPVLQVLKGTATVQFLGAGQQSAVSDMIFRVGSFSGSKTVVLKLEWRSNTNDFDAYAFKIIVFSSTPQWENRSSPATTSLSSVKTVSRDVIWAAGGDGSATGPFVVRTTDGGETVKNVTGNLTKEDLYCVAAVDSERAWVGTGDGKIFATTNGGTIWIEQVYPEPRSPFINGIRFFDAKNGLAMGDPASGGRYVILRTDNGGLNWTHLGNEPAGAPGEAGWNNSFSWTDENHGWFGTNNNRIWRTTNAGGSWSIGSTKDNQNSFGVSFRDNSNGLAIFEGGGMRQSTDGGATWVGISSPSAFSMSGIAFLPGTGNAWTTDGNALYRSTDNGSTWASQLVYPFEGSINHVSFSDTSNGWAVTSAGEVLRYQPAAAAAPSGAPPEQYALEQNYPNPFNSTTTIRYHLPSDGRVTLRIYDILGHAVRTLVDGIVQRGDRTTTLDASSLASGVYFYRLQAETFTETRKLLILK